jgi:hypothetical protein
MKSPCRSCEYRFCDKYEEPCVSCKLPAEYDASICDRSIRTCDEFEGVYELPIRALMKSLHRGRVGK